MSDCPKCRTGKLMSEHGLTYCLSCAYEPPDSAVRPALPQKEKQVDVLSATQIGRACLARVEELKEVVGRNEAAIAAARDEIRRLEKIYALCQPTTSRVPRPRPTTAIAARAEGEPRNSWTCPDCGHKTVTRWVKRHRETECPARREVA